VRKISPPAMAANIHNRLARAAGKAGKVTRRLEQWRRTSVEKLVERYAADVHPRKVRVREFGQIDVKLNISFGTSDKPSHIRREKRTHLLTDVFQKPARSYRRRPAAGRGRKLSLWSTGGRGSAG
jgi:hypothetical protein